MRYYYHYACDGVDDRGWGCVYLQTLCALRGIEPVPTVPELVREFSSRPHEYDLAAFPASRWIEPQQAALWLRRHRGVEAARAVLINGTTACRLTQPPPPPVGADGVAMPLLYDDGIFSYLVLSDDGATRGPAHHRPGPGGAHGRFGVVLGKGGVRFIVELAIYFLRFFLAGSSAFSRPRNCLSSTVILETAPLPRTVPPSDILEPPRSCSAMRFLLSPWACTVLVTNVFLHSASSTAAMKTAGGAATLSN